MKLKNTAALVCALPALAACASIIEGTHAKVNVATTPPSHAACSLSNKLGNWSVSAPGEVSDVQKSKTDLLVSCSDPATGSTGSQKYESTMEPWMLGNVLLGGIIGGGIDFATGGAWDYPKDVTVPLMTPAASANPAYYAPQPAPGTTYITPPAIAAQPAASTVIVTPPATAPQPTVIVTPPAMNMAPAPAVSTPPVTTQPVTVVPQGYGTPNYGAQPTLQPLGTTGATQ